MYGDVVTLDNVYAQRECIDLAQKCGALLQAYEEHLEKIKDTELSAPVNDCIV